MPTLKEIKGRIASVRSTLKITSAMKLVSSAKLRKAQNAIEAMRPYREKLAGILAAVMPSVPGDVAGELLSARQQAGGKVLVIAISSNSSLCGGFNSAVIAKTAEVLAANPGADLWPVGRKIADAFKKAGYPAAADRSVLAEHPSYDAAADMVEQAMSYSDVYLVYNHFVSTSRQVPVCEPLYSADDFKVDEDALTPDIIIEPSPSELIRSLYPKVLKLKAYTALLDSNAAEHAARTVAMQTATDNGENLLQELTLQYNKGRQQKITSEILDLAGAQA